jgi:hypothetical protein
VWVILFLPTLVRKPPPEAPRIALYVLRAAIVGLGLGSQIAMPTQNVVVLVVFWTFVYWHTGLCGLWTPVSPASTAGARRWVGAAALAAIYCGAVAWVGAASLRVPVRAESVGWPYDRGLYDLETPPRGPAFRWTAQHAVAVFPAPKEDAYFQLTFWVHHPDVATHPVHVRIWLRRRLVVDMTVTTPDSVTRYIHVHPGEPSLMIETTVDRTWQPDVDGHGDQRSLGVALQDWIFTCCPPAGVPRVE